VGDILVCVWRKVKRGLNGLVGKKLAEVGERFQGFQKHEFGPGLLTAIRRVYMILPKKEERYGAGEAQRSTDHRSLKQNVRCFANLWDAGGKSPRGRRNTTSGGRTAAWPIRRQRPMRGNSQRPPAPSRYAGLCRPTLLHNHPTPRVRISYDRPCEFGGRPSPRTVRQRWNPANQTAIQAIHARMPISSHVPVPEFHPSFK
jgi:hypothetical protein